MDDDRFETRIRGALDQGLEGIEPDVARRLRRARHEVIARADAADDSLQFYEELDFYQWLAVETERDAG